MSTKIKILALVGASVLSVHALAANTDLKSSADKLSYTIGFEMGQNFKNQSISIEPSWVQKGLEDGVQGKTPLLDQKARQETIVSFQKDMMAKQQQTMKDQSSKNDTEGKTFLDANKAKPDVKTTDSGLQYKILKAGTGPKPALTDTVTVNYSGSLINGKVFDSSYERGKPTTFPLSQVIKGWQDALTMMPVGSTWEVYVPASLAYGAKGMGSAIGPNQTLIFKIELLSIGGKDQPATQPAQPTQTQ